ncbi:MAG: aminotransferase class I/II-fold pyridoxal phosphate-dependent enzyme [Armatimonadota bacterium]|nr:aminotransferase class I/II-fold pyridoxal phosphate-dependent enzyme [Armatimonadota bacterium]MDR7444452.1 aminotransferase class I/II-fold pyridoxal phosphate-dependent enzyme [Armatimonadota bacterium]MDR7570154.1 aminotransferase class I/II-fold pyridoxal phosphate-dependent enzyme [Armatimonadota bacterium]MDR7615243.1 aminotransferase class I/II-fold pyridoxal phosphate-dependent enzyme [Armatimonadota bacterium]
MAQLGFNTLAVHAGSPPDPFGALVPPLYQTSTFTFETVADGARRANERIPAAFYTRWGNPTLRACADRLAALEGGEACLLAASGMAATSQAVLAVVRGGDHLVAPVSLYSGTFELFAQVLPRYGVEVTFVDPEDPENYARAVRPNTKLVYLETPANPVLQITDIAAVARIARQAGILSMADNTFATPYNTRPLALGVDVVVHSATKALGGHHHLVLGAVVGKRDFIERCWEQVRVYGGCADPFAAWLLLVGVQTLGLRMERVNRTALEIARFLAGHPRVERVYYPGLPEHPNHAVARRQMHGFGGMLAFEVRGGLEAGVRLVERLRVIQRAVSLGGVHSLATHPASTTHAHMPREERIRAGIRDGLIRLSVGIEDLEDLLADLEQALE